MEQRSFNLKARLREARKNLVPAISAAHLGRKLLPAKLPGFQPAQASMLELGYRYATWSGLHAIRRALIRRPVVLRRLGVRDFFNVP